MTDLDVETEFTELVDAEVPRVDLVDRAANGSPGFLLMKRDAQGLMNPDQIRDLIGKSVPEPAPSGEEQVTLIASPAAVMRMIHSAAVARPVAKAKYDTDDLRRMAANGQAMTDQSYPIADREDLTHAIRAVGRGGADHDAIRRHVITRAKTLGAASEIPDNWNSDGSLKEGPVAKTMELDDSTDSMDPAVPLAAPEVDAPGDPNDPGSPAWEAIDAATARKWTSLLARAKHAVDMLAEREMFEAVSGDPGDADQAMDLDDACCAIDYAIGVLAPFAVAEQAEADCATDRMTAVGKALAGWDSAPLDTIEALSHVAKAGRVLSSGNEAAIRGAVEQLQKVLASLPAAPEPTEDSGRTVAKQEETVADTATPPETVTADEPVAKAEQTPQVAMYDRKGNLIGIVDPANIVPVAVPEDDEPDEMPPVADDPETVDLTPEPSAEVGIPADTAPDDDVAKTTNPTTNTPSDAESSNTDATTSPDGHSATQERAIAKQAETIAQLAETVETLKGQIRALEEQPAEPKVFTNGAVPPPRPQLRGQDRGAPSADVAKARELKKSLYQGPDATGQNAIHNQLNEMAIAELQNIHNGGARP